jgi:hypothetical protein
MSRKTLIAAALSLVATAALAADPAPRMPATHEMPMHRAGYSCRTDAPAVPHGKHMSRTQDHMSPAPTAPARAAPAPSNIDLHPEDYR